MSRNLRTYSPLTFAFLGDAVYSLYVRSELVKQGNTQANKLHAKASGTVSAPAQAEAYDRLLSEGLLAEDELDMMRRGCNAHVSHQAKHATGMEYHKATGLEALFGYLYMREDKERIEELIRICVTQPDPS